MTHRVILKEESLNAFKARYWPVVVTTALIMLAIGALTVSTASTVIIAAASILLDGPLAIGLASYYIKLMKGEISENVSDSVGIPFSEAFKDYGIKLGTHWWKILWLFLWSLLFVIPGIVKSLSYAMTEYLITEYPQLGARKALKLSMKMMEGHKAELFVLNLSFIGWALLTAITAGIFGIFYAIPYMDATLADYYLELKRYELETGVITEDDLNGNIYFK